MSVGIIPVSVPHMTRLLIMTIKDLEKVMEMGRLAWAFWGRWNQRPRVHHQNLLPCELNVKGPSSFVGVNVIS